MIVYSTVLRSRRVTLPMRRCALRAIVRLRGTERIAVSILLLNERAVKKSVKKLAFAFKIYYLCTTIRQSVLKATAVETI